MSGSGRASSEVIGFVLVFVLIFAGVGAVYTAGLDAVGSVRTSERATSAARAFTVLAGTRNAVERDRVGRTVVLSLGDGRLRVHGGPSLTASANGSDRNAALVALTYGSPKTSMTAVGGGVFRDDPGGTVALEGPALACRPRDHTVLLSIVTLTSSPTGIDTDGPVEVTFSPGERTLRRVDRVSLDISSSPNRAAWERYLRGAGWDGSAAPVYSCQANRTILRTTAVDVRLVH